LLLAGCFLRPVEGSRSLLKYWFPVFLWMAVIFAASTDLMSSQQTSRFIGPVLRWFKPDISPAAIRQIQLFVRKSAHVFEYAILAILLRRALHHLKGLEIKTWNRGMAMAAWGLATVYAIGDELHQATVPTRYGTVNDVLLDSSGAILGLGIVWVWGRWRKFW
jgi:VanZ family protein